MTTTLNHSSRRPQTPQVCIPRSPGKGGAIAIHCAARQAIPSISSRQHGSRTDFLEREVGMMMPELGKFLFRQVQENLPRAHHPAGPGVRLNSTMAASLRGTPGFHISNTKGSWRQARQQIRDCLNASTPHAFF
jgi:hypothetical protein